MAHLRQFCTFYLDDHLFGIELLKVQEVMQQIGLTDVPLAPFSVRGLMNLRGQIVIAVDLRRQLGLAASSSAEVPINVVVRAGGDTVSLIVDRIGDVVEAGDDSFEWPPETLQGNVRSIILGVHKLDKQLMHVVDIDKACALEDRAEFAAADQ